MLLKFACLKFKTILLLQWIVGTMEYAAAALLGAKRQKLKSAKKWIYLKVMMSKCERQKRDVGWSNSPIKLTELLTETHRSTQKSL